MNLDYSDPPYCGPHYEWVANANAIQIGRAVAELRKHKNMDVHFTIGAAILPVLRDCQESTARLCERWFDGSAFR